MHIAKYLSLIVLMLLLSGCGTVVPLDEKWRPLEQLRSRPPINWLGLPESTVTTVGDTVYVRDAEGWLKEYPTDSVYFNAVMKHEQVHSIRQHNYGVWAWIKRYLTDREFMWEEERRGWYEELIYSRDHNHPVIKELVARSLSNYKNAEGPMVSYEEALKWVESVLSGSWKPGD